MKYRLPPLNGLLAFEAAARNRNFAKAAQELNLSQATVSHRVRMLEKHLGCALFERLPRGLKLTESGKAYVPSIEKAFEQIFSSTSGIFGRGGPGSLTVRAPVSYSALWLGPIMQAFLDIYPDIDVRLISSVWADDLAADETDVDLRLGYGNWPGYVSEPVLKETVVPVCNARLVKTARFREMEDLAGHSLIHVMGIEDLWMNYFGRVGIHLNPDRRDIRVDSTLSAIEIASSSQRLALLQKRFLKVYLDSKRLAIALNVEMDIEQAIYLVRPEEATKPKPEAILFKEWLLDQVRHDDR